jgi:short-subunit dehydrogenase
MRVNYLGPVLLTHHALPHLKRARGRIAVVASVAGLTGVPTRTGYAASKHAVFGFFDSLRIELESAGVTVTMIAPDFVLSEIHRRALGPDGRPLGRSPLHEARIMTAEECARRIVPAIERRRRLLITSRRGRAGRWVRLVAPGLIDRIARRAIASGH